MLRKIRWGTPFLADVKRNGAGARCLLWIIKRNATGARYFLRVIRRNPTRARYLLRNKKWNMIRARSQVRAFSSRSRHPTKEKASWGDLEATGMYFHRKKASSFRRKVRMSVSVTYIPYCM